MKWAIQIPLFIVLSIASPLHAIAVDLRWPEVVPSIVVSILATYIAIVLIPVILYRSR